MTNSRRGVLLSVFGVLLSAYGSAGCPFGNTCDECADNVARTAPDAGTRTFELRVLDPSASLSIVRSAKGSLWISESLLSGLPARSLTLEAGATLYPVGTVTVLDGNDMPSTPSASIVSFGERPTERFLVIGSGHAEVRFTDGAPSLVAATADTEVLRIDSGLPTSVCGQGAGPTTAQLSWKTPAHGETFRAIASQTWDAADACIAVVFDDGEKLSACLPKRAWPFEVGDSVRMPINGRDERRLEIHGTEAQHDVLALERGTIVPDGVTSDVTVQVGDLELALRPDNACRAIDATCGTSRVPAYMLEYVDGKGKEVVRGGPIGDERLGVEERWILSAWIEPVGSTACASKEVPPAPAGASVELVTRIKQPRP